MATLQIWDSHEAGYLAFDLRHLIQLLAPTSLTASWIIASPEEAFEATGEGGGELDRLAGARACISGTVLADMANRTVQVIWGEFIGSLPSGEEWIIIRAIDSSFYEIVTSDEPTLAALSANFRDIRRSTCN